MFRITHPTRSLAALLPLLSTLGALPAFAQSRFATQVVNVSQGGGGGIFVPNNVLGGPRGEGPTQGSFDVCSLGVQGSLTVGFDVVITNGPGADFTLFENALTFQGEVYSEVGAVEVSTDGVSFARFPISYAGPQNGFPASFTAPWATYAGLSGCVPVLANVVTNTIDPFDPARSGGEAFDLSDLVGHPLVVGGSVDLAAIHFVRVVDVADGVTSDDFGHLIFDNSAGSSFDLDAVAVIQHTGNVSATQPTVDLFLDAQGFLNLSIEDPDGFIDVDQSQIHVSFNLVQVSITRLRGLMPVVSTTPNGLHMRSSVPIPGSGRRGVLSVSGRDQAGQFSADQIVLQG